ncbi:hypothetical protein CASFOL_001043 [Castilleja foliolosa]|uniref:PUM-HD domain-containing protein n=1 Tax=Castilleja foliolosa TaxID=1961234 RepID=A0ABD3EM11_9LAMI
MERKILENPYSPTSQPPENLLSPHRHPFLPLETRPSPSHFNTTFQHSASDQTIESAFSRLALSPDPRFQAQTPSFLGPNAVGSAESPLEFRERRQALFWAQFQSNNGGTDYTNGLFRAHQRTNVGPESMVFLGNQNGGQYARANDPRLMGYHHCLDFDDDYYYGHSSLHGKKQFLRKCNNSSPISPYAQQSNLDIYRPLEKWPQQITPEVLRGKIVSLAEEQMLSGALDLEEGFSEQEIEMVFPQVVESLCNLMRNQFGSNFVHKLFVACNEDQRTRIIMALTKSPYKLITICLNSHGARAVQKLLERLSTPQQISLVVSALSPGAVTLAIDQNGHHVILYCVRSFPEEYNKPLFNEIAGNCFKIATNKSGCCVLPPSVEYSHGETRERLIREIIENVVHLSEDRYGNYVVQHIIGLGMQEVRAHLSRRLQGSFLSLSCNKHASNVVEKLLLESGENQAAAIIMELLKNPNAPMLLLDAFGNYVIQTALSVSKGPVHDALLNLIKVNAPYMQSNLFGKKILAGFEKRKFRNV